MSILIKGMTMPKNCANCQLRASCVHRIYMEERPSDCRLVELPPHGALMDRDDFFATFPELVDWYKHITDDFVVVEAEGEDDG